MTSVEEKERMTYKELKSGISSKKSELISGNYKLSKMCYISIHTCKYCQDVTNIRRSCTIGDSLIAYARTSIWFKMRWY